LEYGEGPPLGETLVLATTNGTRAIVAAAADAEAVLIGSLANLTACAAQAARIARDGERDGRGDFRRERAEHRRPACR
jgi:phosphosulfolactate phosphohydrolase-like enzyme